MIPRMVAATAVALLAAVAMLPSAAEPQEPGHLDALAVAKTVVARADLTGEVAEARLLTRLVAEGQGPVTIVDPTATDGLRDLDRFRAPSVRDGAAVWDLDLDGVAHRRTLARFATDAMPVAVAVRADLDGRPTPVEDLEGATGEVTLRVLLRNLTTAPRPITYRTAEADVDEEVEVAVPMVARLRTDLGPTWLDVDADPAAVAVVVDRSRVQWTTALFEPLGAVEQELEIRARLEGGQLPELVVEAVPVAEVAELAVVRELLVDGQADAAVTAFGLEEGGEGLAAIGQGVAGLLTGLAELGTGARELGTGAAEAADGAGELADGAAAGADGARDLAQATARAGTGSEALADALGALAQGEAGIGQGTDELAEGLGELADGSGQLAGGTRELADATTLLAREVDAAIAELEEIVAAVPDLDLDPLVTGLSLARDTLETIQELLAEPGKLEHLLDALGDRVEETLTVLEELRQHVDDPAKVDQAIALVEANRQAVDRARAELDDFTRRLADGLGELITTIDGLLAAAEALDDLDPDALLDGIDELAQGIQQLAAGVDELADGAGQLHQGLLASAAGSRQLADGAADAAGGAAEAAGGADELADGLRELAGGGDELAAGLVELAGGTGELAAGLARLAGGGDALADGIGEATAGVADLEGGIEQLAEEVIAFLRDAADGTGGDLARDLARIDALLARAGDGVPHGAPEEAAASAAYEIRLTATPAPGIGAAGQLTAGLFLLALAAGIGRAATRRSGLEV